MIYVLCSSRQKETFQLLHLLTEVVQLSAMTGSVLLKLCQLSIECVLMFSPEDGKGILEGGRVTPAAP